MHRIDTKTAQKDKFGAGKNGFTRGNPQTGTPATDLDDDYFDMLQEELCSVVEASGASLEKGRHDQLLTALRALLLSRKNPFGDIKSDGTVKTALENLGLQTIKPDPVSTKIFSPDLKKFLLVSNTSWGMWNNDTGAAIALPVTQGGTGKTTVDGVKAAFGIDKLQPKGNYVITDASTKQSLSDALSCRYGLEVTDSNNIIRVGIYSTNNQATITGINGKAIIIPDKAGTMALAGESVSALRLSAPREVTVTTADAWMNFTTSEMVVGIYITPTPGGGAWVLNKVKVATLQAYINGAWVNVTQ